MFPYTTATIGYAYWNYELAHTSVESTRQLFTHCLAMNISLRAYYVQM
jgi:hypothetical protein